jgi:hypothetical protein
MLKIKIRNTSGLVTGHAKLPILVVVIVCMACLVPLSMPAPRAYSQSSNDAIPLDDPQMSQYFEVPVPDSDDKGFFYLTAPDGWTKMQIQPYIDGIETVSAAEFCAPEGCGEASLQLYAYLSTPGSFFPPGGAAQPEQVFQGIVDYSEGLGIDTTQVVPIEGPNPQVDVYIEGIDDQGQKMKGFSDLLLSEQPSVLYEATFFTKEANWDHYYPIFLDIQKTIKAVYPTDLNVICHESQTPECLGMVSGMMGENTRTMNTIIDNMDVTGCSQNKYWDPAC